MPDMAFKHRSGLSKRREPIPNGDDPAIEQTTFAEHILMATVTDVIDDEDVQELIRNLNAAMELPGVLAAHVGRPIAVLGDHTFMMHIRAVDTATCDAAYRKANEVFEAHVADRNLGRADDFFEMVMVDWESQPVGASGAKWPAIRVAVFKLKPNVPREKWHLLEEQMDLLPKKFPLIKQVCWGKNSARERMYRDGYGYADVDQDFGIVLGFSSCVDMEELGADPAYWELLNYLGNAILENYVILTLCSE